MNSKIGLIVAFALGLAGRPFHLLDVKIATPEHVEPFYVAGYQVRTNNANEISGHGEIGNLWKRFMGQNLGAQIPNRAGAANIVVYSDYASDERGDYSYLLGARVTSVKDLPAGMSYTKVVAGPYAVLTTERGPLVEVLQARGGRYGACRPPNSAGNGHSSLTMRSTTSAVPILRMLKWRSTSD
ncbi:MAG: effector binding domain-containing protein [Terracidiphilus sp.]|jgi:predicted transcriptional regulator YdeE